jgi:hypothetical protein
MISAQWLTLLAPIFVAPTEAIVFSLLCPQPEIDIEISRITPKTQSRRPKPVITAGR